MLILSNFKLPGPSTHYTVTGFFIFMDFTEKQIEDLIFQNLNPIGLELLTKRGLDFINDYRHFERQLNLGRYGILDLIGFNFNPIDCNKGEEKTIQVGIIELKKGQINASTYLQAARYAVGVHHAFLKYKSVKVNISLHIIGSTIALDEMFCLIGNNITAHTFTLDLVDGIKFKSYTTPGYNQPNFPINNTQVKGIINYIKSEVKNKIDHIKSIDEFMAEYRKGYFNE